MNVDFPHEIKGLWIPNTRSTDFISASLLSANLTSSSWCASAQLEPKLMWILIWCRHHISTWLISNHWQFSANKDHIWCFQSCLVATFQKYRVFEMVARVWHAWSVHWCPWFAKVISICILARTYHVSWVPSPEDHINKPELALRFIHMYINSYAQPHRNLQ